MQCQEERGSDHAGKLRHGKEALEVLNVIKA